MLPFFSKHFKRQVKPEGQMIYWFQTCYKQTENSASWNEKPPLAVDGEIVYSDSKYLEDANMATILEKLPEETSNPVLLKNVFEQWIQDCSSAFVQSPTVSQCLANTVSVWDSNAQVATVLDSEESKDWILQWIPTRIKVDKPIFQVYWAPSYKIINTPIPILLDIADQTKSVIKIGNHSENPDIQSPEKTYTILPSLTTRQGDWLQEIPDLQVPLSEGPTLRLDNENSSDPVLEKYRRRIHDARIKAKLARYRADRLAQRFEERFGFYPSENEEEAETEADLTEAD